MHELFRKFAMKTSKAMGSPLAFGAGIALVLVWAATGPRFGYSETWQLVINTGTTIITFLMVFIIQYSQNRDTQILHLKIDELLRAITEARTSMVNLEDETDEILQTFKDEFRGLGQSEDPEAQRIDTAS